MLQALLYIACAVLLVVPIALVFHCRYEDRVGGRVGLGMIAFGALVVLLEGMTGEGYAPSVEIVCIILGVAVHQAWQLVHFLLRIRKERRLKRISLDDTIPGRVPTDATTR